MLLLCVPHRPAGDVYKRQDVARAARAIHAVFHPDKVNYGAYGDTGRHLHFHLVPKYQGGYEWGDVFGMNPGRTFLSQEEYTRMIEQIKLCLLYTSRCV